jgi:hypothetical protein
LSIKSISLSFLLFTFYLLFLSGCGYKPSSHYVKNSINGKVYVDVIKDVRNSSNSILIHDTINNMVLSRFDNLRLTNDKNIADTIIIAKFGLISHEPYVTDTKGYVKTYRTIVNIDFEYINKIDDKKGSFRLSGFYDFNIGTDSVLSDQEKQDAIKIASQKALQNLFSKIAITNM